MKLSPPPGCKAECVIINAVECEPYLTADHRLMLEKADEVDVYKRQLTVCIVLVQIVSLLGNILYMLDSYSSFHKLI